jgi:hypothetical protein
MAGSIKGDVKKKHFSRPAEGGSFSDIQPLLAAPMDFACYGDVSILVPLSDMAFASSFLTYATKGQNPAKFQVRIKYSDSVNAANNYARAKQWTFGIEASK